MNMADEIVEITKRLDGSVTHGNLLIQLGERIAGDYSIVFEPLNIVIFVGVSQEFADAVHLLQKEKPKRVTIRPITELIALIDGCPIPGDMPWAKSPPKNGYKEPHFAPVCFDPVKGGEGKE